MPELTVASLNLHWGRGGKRARFAPFDVVEACRSFDADVIGLQESWAPDDGIAQHDEVAAALGCQVVSVPMGRAVMSPTPRMVGGADPERAVGDGDVCVALLSRLPLRTTRVIPLPKLRLDRWARALLHAELDVHGTNLAAVVTHFSHLEFGSPLHTRSLRRGLPPPDRPAVFFGDLNMWGWTISAMAPPGWRRVVRGKTWPAHRPRHQIDHVLVTPGVTVVQGEVLPDVGSDHRPVRATLRMP